MLFYTIYSVDQGEQHSLGCKCCRLFDCKDLPIPRHMTRADAEHHAGNFKASILEAWKSLEELGSRFEPKLQKRWSKKTIGQRRRLLENAWKDISITHRPDFASFRHPSKAKLRSITCRAEAYLWPYINIEDLQKPTQFLWFIHSRIWNPPIDFVLNDIQEAHLGPGWNFSSSAACVQPGEPSDTVTTTLDLLVLEIQQHIYTFLLQMGQSILHDFTAEEIKQQPTQVPLQPRDESLDLASFTARVLFKPYLPFGKVDMEPLLTNVGSRKDLARDHLTLLREDPGYFLASMQEWKEHTELGNCYEVAKEIIYTAIADILYWDRLFSHANVLSNTGYIAEESWIIVMDAISSIRDRLELNLILGLPCSPRMRQYYDWSDVSPLMKHNPPDAVYRIHILFELLAARDKRVPHNIHHVIDEIQHALDTDSALDELLTQWIMQQLSDLAVLLKVEISIEKLDYRRHSMLKKGALEHRIPRLPTFDQLVQACDEMFTDEILTYDRLKVFKYPVSNQRNEANTHQRRTAEQALDSFWSVIEKHVQGSKYKDLFAFIQQSLPGEPQRTPEWAPIALPPKRPLAPHGVGAERASVADIRVRDPFVSVRYNDKAKTRGVPILSGGSADLPIDEDDTPQKVEVPRHIYEVLSAMMPNTKAEHSRKQFRWKELVNAMQYIGFKHEKLHGSARIFQPKAKEECLLALPRSIQFHEPEEVRKGSKIPPDKPRVFGRRLKHAFGWEDGLFVLSHTTL